MQQALSLTLFSCSKTIPLDFPNSFTKKLLIKIIKFKKNL